MKAALRIARQLFKLCLTADGKLDFARVEQVVKKLAASKPRGYLGILKQFYRLVRLEAEKSQAVVETAVELDAGIKKQVESDLKNKYGDQLTFEYKTNPDLLGGMRVKVGSDVWDGSVKARLDRLSTALS
ncbi:MAG: F0F1 ATP synthase subunit delta [Verrucomicrobiota bacterium]